MGIQVLVGIHDEALRALVERSRGIPDSAFPVVREGVAAAAANAAETWKRFAGGENVLGGVPPLEYPSGKYARSIGFKRTGNFKWTVYTNYKVAEFIERGTRGMNPAGPKSRQAADGSSYVIVPFRWGTPKTAGKQRNAMGVNVYSVVRNFNMRAANDSAQSRVVLNAGGDPVARRTYRWEGTARNTGFRLSAAQAESPRQVGMIRSAGQNGKSGGYFTFRVCSSKGPAWKGMKGRDVIGALARQTQAETERLVEAAWRAELAHIL